MSSKTNQEIGPGWQPKRQVETSGFDGQIAPHCRGKHDLAGNVVDQAGAWVRPAGTQVDVGADHVAGRDAEVSPVVGFSLSPRYFLVVAQAVTTWVLFTSPDFHILVPNGGSKVKRDTGPFPPGRLAAASAGTGRCPVLRRGQKFTQAPWSPKHLHSLILKWTPRNSSGFYGQVAPHRRGKHDLAGNVVDQAGARV